MASSGKHRWITHPLRPNRRYNYSVSLMFRVLLTLLLVISTPLAANAAPGGVTDAQVLEAIEKIKTFLYDKQDPVTSSWEFRSREGGLDRDKLQIGGETALVVLSLLVAGEPAQHPKLSAAVEYLKNLQTPGTYARSMRAHVWSNLPPEYMPRLKADANWLLGAAAKHSDLLFDYQSVRSAYIDNSVTQYGILGLWQASKRGVKIPSRYWQKWVDHFLKSQLQDGSWVYAASEGEQIGGAGSGNIFDSPGTGSTTTTGITTLLIAQQEIYRDRRVPHPAVYDAIDKGMGWLDNNFNLHTAGSGYNHYYLYSIERVASANGVRFLNGVDWYERGAELIIQDLKQVEETAHDPVKMAFALMFLSRGRYPLWVTKLTVPGLPCNNHPSDLYYATLFVSNLQESEVNFQSMSINADSVDWINAPAAYLASNAPVNLSEKQKDNLRQFIGLGGLLITSADDNNRDFIRSIQKLAEELYPEYPAKDLDPNEPLLYAWQPIPARALPPIKVVSNGARPLIVMLENDFGYKIQSDPELGETPEGKMLANLFAYVTDKGVLANRQHLPFELNANKPETGNLTVARVRYDGNWLPEPLAWKVQADYVANHTGFVVETTPADPANAPTIEQLGESDLKLAHLAGTDAITLTPDQIASIRRYAERGGTILVETVGGRGTFSQSLQKQLIEVMGVASVPLTGDDPVISGHGLARGADNTRTLYRRYAATLMSLDPSPNLQAIFLNDERPSIIFSPDDLTLGMLGCRHWDILGYQPDSARKLIANIVLWADQQTLNAPQAAIP